MQPRRLGKSTLVGLLLGSVCILGGRTAAAPVPAPWFAADIGETGAIGATDVSGTPPIFSVRGSGNGIYTIEDSFHFCYQVLRGNGSLSARFQRAESDTDPEERAGLGLMVRDSTSPGAPNLYYVVEPRGVLTTTIRFQQGSETEDRFGAVLPPEALGVGLSLRLQRAGQEITGFFSQDGILWRQAAFPAQTLPTLRPDALLGLAVTSHRFGDSITGVFDQVAVQPGEVSVSNLVGAGADRSTLLQWRGVTGATGYNVYRGALGATRDQLVRVNTSPFAGSTFTDRSAGLANGTPQTYAVAPVLQGPGGTSKEGPAVAVDATPVSVPAGWLGTALGALSGPGSAIFDLNARVITLRGSGAGILGGRASELYFLSQAVDGDVQITAKLRSHDPRIAGIMIRESLDPVARHACLYTRKLVADARDGVLFFSAQSDPSDAILTLPATSTRAGEGVFWPVLMRLTRRGNTFEFEYSTDNGITYRQAAAPSTFGQPLPRTLYVGLVTASGDRRRTAEARFDIPTIQKL